MGLRVPWGGTFSKNLLKTVIIPFSVGKSLLLRSKKPASPFEKACFFVGKRPILRRIEPDFGLKQAVAYTAESCLHFINRCNAVVYGSV
jgi:hypothetical protein